MFIPHFGHQMAAVTSADITAVQNIQSLPVSVHVMTWCQRGRYLLDVAYPVPDVIEGLLVGDVIHQHDALQHKDRKRPQHRKRSVRKVNTWTVPAAVLWWNTHNRSHDCCKQQTTHRFTAVIILQYYSITVRTQSVTLPSRVHITSHFSTHRHMIKSTYSTCKSARWEWFIL